MIRRVLNDHGIVLGYIVISVPRHLDSYEAILSQIIDKGEFSPYRWPWSPMMIPRISLGYGPPPPETGTEAYERWSEEQNQKREEFRGRGVARVAELHRYEDGAWAVTQKYRLYLLEDGEDASEIARRMGGTLEELP